MNPKIKKAWIAALRSSGYVQGTGKLRQTVDGVTKFCCLGVLCNLHAQANPEFAATQLVSHRYDGENVLPSERVLNWVGIDSDHIRIDDIEDSIVNHLWKRNDGAWSHYQHSFGSIADFIEEHL